MKLGVTCLLVVCSLCVRGEDAKVPVEARGDTPPPAKTVSKIDEKLDWNVEPEHWEELLGRKGSSDFASSAGDNTSAAEEARIERVLRKLKPQDGLRLGESDVVFSSPILEGLVPRRLPDDASLGEKILGLPIVRLFRPLPMPSPPGGGKYFKWGSRDQAWAEFNRPVSGPGRADNGM